MLPRYFIASARSKAGEPTRDDAAAIEDVLAVVELGAAELFVGVDRKGRLCAVDASARRALSPRAQAQVAFHEVASRRTVAVDADALYLFDLQLVELLRDAPGLNDPLYLYGSLRGPYPDALGRETAPIDGQLTVTRADLLAALIAGVERSFRYERSERGVRCVHALLPGEPVEELDRGRGLVLAFPLALAGMLGGIANDPVAAQIFYDVIGALHAELRVQGVTFPPLPVPSRSALEDALIAQGWRIEGDTAIRRPGDRGIVASILGRGEERRTLPREAKLEDYVAEASALLTRMGAPTPATAAIRRRCAPATPLPVTPTPPAPPPPPPPPSLPSPRPKVETPRTEWIRDFVDAHRAPERPAPRLVRPDRVVAPAQTPEWMRDFAEPDSGSDEADPPAEQPPADWAKDFD